MCPRPLSRLGGAVGYADKSLAACAGVRVPLWPVSIGHAAADAPAPTSVSVLVVFVLVLSECLPDCDHDEPPVEL